MSEFERVLAGLHAEGRQVDRTQTLFGAFAVAAEAYPHQIDSVHRMLTAPTCRWLLADEVGLGKTVQAIMVMKALAASRSRPLAVALTVPDDLVAQWEQELLCRGDVVALESGESGGISGNILIRLLRPSKLVNGEKIAANKIDLLLVDEFTRLQGQVRRELISAARTIPNVIAMTATPALHLAANRRELLALLEPEAAEEANATDTDILRVLRNRETEGLNRFGQGIVDVAHERLLASSFGMYRRIIRTVRSDYPGVLPKRRYQPLRVKPTDGDIGRAAATRKYIDAAKRTGLELRAEALFQVSGRSPQSLRERLSTLRRTNAQLQSAWRAIDTSLRDEGGDAKLDALIDHLRVVHARPTEARVVVVAEDNPTTDYLREAIEKLTDMKVARKRRTVGAAEELHTQVTSLKEALDDFISGEARVLVAADAAKEGHNLQFADEIIFFALPWSPTDIQQWIGRIDRLGAKNAAAGRTITITPIVTEGSIEDNILNVLEGTGVFQKSEVFDEADWAEISKAIDAAASGKEGASWTVASREAAKLGEHFDEWITDSRFSLRSRSPLALERFERLKRRAYAVPLISSGPQKNWYRDRERGLGLMIKLARQDYLEVRNQKCSGQRFQTVWYKQKPANDDLVIPDLDARSPSFRQAYISKREDLECPPRPSVSESDGRQRKLNFLDHGNSLHEGMNQSFGKLAPQTDWQTEFVIDYAPGHPALAWQGKAVLLSWSRIDVPFQFVRDVTDEFDPVLDESKPEQDARLAVLRLAVTHSHADQRWLADCCPSELIFTTVAVDPEVTQSVAAAAALLNPFHENEAARFVCRRRKLPDARAKAAKELARKEMQKHGETVLRRYLSNLRSTLDARLFEVEADMRAHLRSLEAIAETMNAKDQNFEFNRAAARGAALHIELARRAWEKRLERLKGVEERVGRSTRFTKSGDFWVSPRRKQDG
ncbi:helicase-related protein [Sinorhizobium meliloti]|uniref:helicase-related protein n=1 Tax=Rhizobium meliloti TaxID=382 RepID=UPI00398C971E